MDQRVVGRGRLYFEPDNSQTPGERYLGNTPSLAISRKLTKVKSTKSVRGVLVDAGAVVVKEEHSISFETDNISDENLQLWFGASKQISQAPLDTFSMPMIVYRGHHYQVGETPSRPLGLGMTQGLRVLFAGVDIAGAYEVDDDNGRFYIPKTSSIPDGATVVVEGLIIPQTTSTVGSEAREVVGKLRYVSDNPTLRQLSIVWPKVAITPSSDLDMKSRSSWVTLSFAGDVRKIPGLPFVMGYSKAAIGQIYPGGPDLFEFLSAEDRLNTLVNVTMPSRGYPVL